MSKVSKNAHYYVAGFGLYYGLSWIFTFYPAFVIGLFACQCCERSIDGTPEFIGLVVMIIAYAVIQILITLEKFELVAFCYLITLWPFLKILKHCWDYVGESDTFPLPPVDWIPIF